MIAANEGHSEIFQLLLSHPNIDVNCTLYVSDIFSVCIAGTCIPSASASEVGRVLVALLFRLISYDSRLVLDRMTGLYLCHVRQKGV
jgi:hypothetical protein